MDFNTFHFSPKFTSRNSKTHFEYGCGFTTAARSNLSVAAVPLKYFFVILICVYLPYGLFGTNFPPRHFFAHIGEVL